MSTAYLHGYQLRKDDIQWKIFRNNSECYPGLFYATESACIMAIEGAPKDPSKVKAYWEEKVAFCKLYNHKIRIKKDTH